MLILTLKLTQYSSVDLDKTSPHDAVQYYTTAVLANPTCHCYGSIYSHLPTLPFSPAEVKDLNLIHLFSHPINLWRQNVRGWPYYATLKYFPTSLSHDKNRIVANCSYPGNPCQYTVKNDTTFGAEYVPHNTAMPHLCNFSIPKHIIPNAHQTLLRTCTKNYTALL